MRKIFNQKNILENKLEKRIQNLLNSCNDNEIIHLINRKNLLNESDDSELRELVKRIKKLKNRGKLLNYFIKTKSKPAWMAIKYLPVLPPNLRPILELKDQDRKIIKTDLNELYAAIIKCNNTIHRFQLGGMDKHRIKQEKYNLQKAVETLIENDTENSTENVRINFIGKRKL